MLWKDYFKFQKGIKSPPPLPQVGMELTVQVLALKHFSFVSSGNLTDVRVRIINDGSSSMQGRVEVYYSGLWGKVCGDGWDIENGHLVCRKLGFSRVLSR